MPTSKTFVPLQQRLKTDIAKSLMDELGIKNVNALPKLTKVVLNVGLSQKKYSAKDIQAFIADQLAVIACQRPSVRRSRMSISNFNIRENMIVGMAVTLRGKNMYNFLDRLISYVLPRIRDFRGINPKLDGRGNLAIGITDQSIFPELPAPEANKIFGMQIQITTNAGDDKKGMALFKRIGMPFRRPVARAGSSVEKAK